MMVWFLHITACQGGLCVCVVFVRICVCVCAHMHACKLVLVGLHATCCYKTQLFPWKLCNACWWWSFYRISPGQQVKWSFFYLNAAFFKLGSAIEQFSNRRLLTYGNWWNIWAERSCFYWLLPVLPESLGKQKSPLPQEKRQQQTKKTSQNCAQCDRVFNKVWVGGCYWHSQVVFAGCPFSVVANTDVAC